MGGESYVSTCLDEERLLAFSNFFKHFSRFSRLVISQKGLTLRLFFNFKNYLALS